MRTEAPVKRLGGFRARLAAGVALAVLSFAAPAPTIAMEAEDVRVRYGRHADYVRLVFDWKEETPYRIDLQPKGAFIEFDAPNGFDFSRVEGLQRVSAKRLENGSVHVRYDRARSLKHFRHGTRIVVDLYETEAGEQLPDLETVMAAMAEAEAAKKAEPEAPETPAAAYPPPPPRRGDQMASAEPPSKPMTTPTPAASDGQKTMAASDPAASAPKTAETPAMAKAPETPSASPAAPMDPSASKPMPAMASPPQGPPDLAAIPPEDLRGVAVSSAPPKIEPAARLTVETVDGSILLGIGAPDMRAAAYSRVGGHWIVLDAPLDVDFSAAHAAGLDALQLPFPDKTVIYIDGGPTPHMTAWRGESGWRFRLTADREPARGQALTVDRRKSGASGPRFSLDRLQGAKLLRVIDPEVGDALFVAVVKGEQHIAEAFDAPDAGLPPTAVGVVVEPRAEGVSVRLADRLLEVRKRGGLRFSDPNRLLLGSDNVRPTSVDLEAWRGKSPNYIEGVVARMAKMNGVADFGRNAYRLDLARYSLAWGYASEALGYLQSITQSDKGASERTETRMLRGIARAMLGQHDLAAVDLDDDALVGDPNVEIWRALAMAEREEHRYASAKFQRYWDAVAAWPPRFRARLTVAAGESSLAAGLPDVAERFLQQSHPDLAPSLSELAGNAIVSGKIKASRGDAAGAKLDFKHARAEGNLETQAKAELELIRIGYAEGALNADQAAERLRRLQLNWRGDRIEYETLKTWGEIRLEQSQFREGFWALNEASHFYSERFDTSDLRATMSSGFAHAFVEGAADKLPALEAVALFQDFKALAPPGGKGDLALANFAGRLIDLDLVDEADELLDHLVRHRLTAEPRVEAAAELATLRISRRQWTDALSTLDQVADTKKSPERHEQHLRLRAQALSGLGRTGDALALLTESQDVETMWLRAEMAWGAADWIRARKSYRDLDTVGALDGAKLAVRQSATVLRWAVAAHLLRNGEEVREVARRFQAKIEDPALAEALKALATPDASGGGDALAAARAAIANADALTRAVTNYAGDGA